MPAIENASTEDVPTKSKSRGRRKSNDSAEVAAAEVAAETLPEGERSEEPPPPPLPIEAYRLERPPRTNELVPKGGKVRKIAIVGYTASRGEAPWGDSEWEIWGLNDLHSFEDCHPSRFDRWFDLHPEADIRADKQQAQWLANATIPTYVWNAREDWPSTVSFPRDALREAFQSDYFTNSIAWMTAFAITELAWALDEFKRTGDPELQPTIGVFGVDMATSSEYGAQRPSCEYFLGIAAGAGFMLQIAETSDLLSIGEMYGVTDGPLRRKLNARSHELRQRMEQLREREGALRGELEQIVGHLNACQGALDNNEYIRSVWTMPEIDRDKASAPGQLERA